MKIDFTALFCPIDDFVNALSPVINLLADLAAYCFQQKTINHANTSSSNLILLSKTQVNKLT